MNRVPLGRRAQIINCLVEGNSIRSTERMTGTHRDTICRLLVEVGDGCARLMDEQMRELPCRRIEVDEIWAYVRKKQRHMTPFDDPRRLGDQGRPSRSRVAELLGPLLSALLRLLSRGGLPCTSAGLGAACFAGNYRGGRRCCLARGAPSRLPLILTSIVGIAGDL
jgi:hypothetical protein